MGTPSTVYGFNRPASGDAVSAFQATINADLEEIDGLLKGLADPTYIVGAASAALNNELTLGGGAILAPVVLGSRPAASLAGRLQAITDLGVVQRDTGAAWATVAALTKSGTTLPTASADGAGSLFLDTDDDGGTPFLNTGVSMVQFAKGVSEAPSSHAPSHRIGGGDPLWLYAEMTADQSFTDQSLDNVTELLIGLDVPGTWLYKLVMMYEGSTTCDLRLAITGPAASTGFWLAPGSPGTGASSQSSLSNTLRVKIDPYTTPLTEDFGGTGVGGTSIMCAVIEGKIVNPTNPGNLQVQACRAAAGGGETSKILTHSYLLAIQAA